MPAPSPTIPPISNANLWMFFVLNGVNSPGTIPRGGIKGFKRETGWDIKKGKGTQGATLTLKTLPPVEGSIDLQLITDVDIAGYDRFVREVLSISPEKQKASGLSIFHPQFSAIGLQAVVVKHYTGPEHQGKGMYLAHIELIEWLPPPKASIVSTVSTTKPDIPDTQTPPPDPRIQRLEADIATVQQALKP